MLPGDAEVRVRTTLNIADDVFEVAKSIAHVRKVSIGEALSDLARRGMDAEPRIGISPVTGLPVVLKRPGSRPITSEEVYRLHAEEDLDKALEFMGKR